jgi:LmbE family N-acetylglucosaminyl deacetylase
MTDALMIVAHPDDETIWAGALIAREKNWNWTIAALCRASDTDREPKFRRVCEMYKAKPIIFDLEDTLLGEIDNKEVQKLLLPLTKKNYDLIYTHGENGEYGHIRHKDCHKAVIALVKAKKLRSKKLFVFAYKKNGAGKIVPSEDATEKTALKKEEIEMKRKIVAEMYGYPYNGIDVNYCTETEAFKEIDLK